MSNYNCLTMMILRKCRANYEELTSLINNTVYNLVTNGLNQVIMSIRTGVPAMFGNMIANGEIEEIKSSFKKFEWSIHTLVVLLFTLCGILILPFVEVYTAGVHDAEYQVPLFAYIFTLAQACYCIRVPYNMIVMAAGHYRQTQNSAIIEAALNIILSVALVSRHGLIGVAIATLVAMVYRSIYFAIYISRNIIYHKITYFLKHIMIDILCVVIMASLCSGLHLESVSYASWLIMAIKAGSICVVVSGVINFIFYKNYMIEILNKVIKKGRKK